MSEVFDFPVLAVSALTQAFGFLYGRAAAVLDRRAARREGSEHGEPEPVPAVVVGDPGPLTFDDSALTPERIQRLEMLTEILGTYNEHRELIRADDGRLMGNLGGLRSTLEAIEGRRLTFHGESRPTSGVRIEQELDDVHGSATALKARRVAGTADVGIHQKVKTVHPGSEIVGAEIEELG
ncbi:hypothetical protein [Streptomyces laurentii]|uniref:hypothetical protein n=1 Tax=Streptomyces laurentii TaxID=39478 RepID=UPI0033F475FD